MTTESNSSPAPSSLNLVAGQKLAGCYQLDRPLETGGEFPVWLAQDEVLGKSVALHFLPAAITKHEAALDELRVEVKRSRALIHPNILRVYDLVEEADWTAVATDAFDGRCLAALLKEKGHFEVDDVEPWLDQICVTLEEAHRLRLTHRDIAPENIFVTPAGKLQLAYFGISRIVQDALHDAAGDGSSPARLYTMSPQLLEGDAPTPTDDVYGIGTLLFELLAGRPVFVGGDVLEKIQHEVPPKLSEIRDEMKDPGALVPPGWENVIGACLNKASDERPHRPSEVVSSIEAYAPPEEIPAPLPVVDEAAETVTELPAGLAPMALKLESAAPVTPPEEPAPMSLAREEHPLAVEPESAAAPEPPPAPEPVSALDSEVKAEEPVAPAAEISASEPEAEKVEDKLAEPVVHEPVIKPAPEMGSLSSRPAPPAPPPYTKYYEVEEDAFSSILPKRYRFPTAVGAVLLAVLAAAMYFFGDSKEKPAPRPALATTDSSERSERSELTSVKNSVPEPSPAASTPEPAKPEAKKTEVAEATPAPKAPEKPMQTIVIAANSNPNSGGPATVNSKSAPAPERVAPTVLDSLPPSVASGPVGKQLTDKATALDRLRQEIADADKADQTRVKDQQAADAAIAEAKKAIEEKTKAAASAKKATEELLAVRKKREEDQKTADAAAVTAQQLALEKTKAAEDAKKALAEFETQNRDKLSSQDKVDAEIQTLQTTLAERQNAADLLAKSASTTASTRQQKQAAAQQAEQELAQLKANAAKASVEDEKRKQADAEKKKLDDELASMRAMFEQKMKDIEDRRKQLDGSGAPTSSAPSAMPAPPVAVTKPAATPAPIAPAPTPTLPLMAMKTEPPKPALPAGTPVLAPALPTATPAAGANSLGLRFVPVGDVSFSVWQTRVKDFESFAKAVNLKSTAWRGPGFRQGPDHPVVNVTWTEAIAFCKWLTDKEHKEGTLPANQFYRLPYDMEWSKAVGLTDENGKTPEARDMGVPDVYPWGTDWPPPKGAGNYTGEETGSDVAIKGYDDGFAWTAPVGSFPPNKYGLYDMGGNVWQWCMDSWNNESKAKVLRGASWYNGALKLSLLSSCRVHASPDSSTDNYGFRIVRAVETAAAKPAKK